jgi:hypothetical protein
MSARQWGANFGVANLGAANLGAAHPLMAFHSARAEFRRCNAAPVQQAQQ